MSFATEIKADLDRIVADVFGETVRYKPHGGAWNSIPALVENEREDIGLSVKDSIFVTASKTDVSSVDVTRDVIEWGGKEYTVHLIVSQDAAGWRLYCVR